MCHYSHYATNWRDKLRFLLSCLLLNVSNKHNSETVGAPLPAGTPVTRRSNHPIVTPLCFGPTLFPCRANALHTFITLYEIDHLTP